MNQSEGNKIFDIGLLYQKSGKVWEYVVVTERHDTHLLSRQQALDWIKKIFSENKNSTTRLLVSPPCKLTQAELHYVSNGTLDHYYRWDRSEDESEIREGHQGASGFPPESIVPNDAKKLPFQTESYAFYYHKHKGKTTLFVEVLDYHPGILAIPLDKLEELVQYLRGELT